MPLTNFGAILNFAETLEKDDMGFYARAVGTLADGAHQALFEALAGEGKKNIALVQRTRRENVTEMILEPIQGLARGSYQVATNAMDTDDLVLAAIALEQRAYHYYSDAADKIRALPEVSRALKMLAKKRNKRLGKLQDALS